MKKTLLTIIALALMAGTASAVDLIADGGDPLTAIPVGTVDVSDDGTTLTVVYTTVGGWELVETHLGINDGIIVKGKGNVKVGQLSVAGEKTGREFDPAVTTTTYTVLLADLGVVPGDTITLAAHAAVEILVDPDPQIEDDEYIREESAWGEGPEFADDRNWAMYFEYDIPDPDLIVSEIILVSDAIYATDPLAFTYTVANVGGEGPAGNSVFDVAGYLSTDAVLDASDTMILGPGGSSGTYSVWTYHLSVGWSNSLPVADGDITGTAPGTYYLIVDADTLPGQPPNFYPGVVESNEDNNCLAIQFTVLAAPTP